MIQISNLTLRPNEDFECLRQQAAKILGVPASALGELTLQKQSIDARKKGQVHYVCSVTVSMPNEQRLIKRARGRGVTLFEKTAYHFPTLAARTKHPPVVVGMGPAGLFAALYLARAGLPSIILERGAPIEQRTKAVQNFWCTGELDTECNVQFGEGGAGTFSDGKLTTGTHDPRIAAVMDTFVAAGAPSEIKYLQKPHIGTDILRDVMINLRKQLLSLGCEIRFGHKLSGLLTDADALRGVMVQAQDEEYSLACDALVLALGHSARDTFSMLHGHGVPMEQKSFAIGVRIEHLQAAISQSQYGAQFAQFPAADYKLACHLPNGRSAFSFCVCPGGEVVAAASEQGGVVTNGMSYYARDGANINGGLLVGVTPQDFGSDDVLAGVEFQRHWEQAAFSLGGGGFVAPTQRVEDFLQNRPSSKAGAIIPSYQCGVRWTSLDECLPNYVTDTLRGAIPILGQKLKGFAHGEGVLTGVETRSSSPVRILRDNAYQSALRGLFPCGEGAGYAGGIVSAAVDGIRVAEAIAQGICLQGR